VPRRPLPGGEGPKRNFPEQTKFPKKRGTIQGGPPRKWEGVGGLPSRGSRKIMDRSTIKLLVRDRLNRQGFIMGKKPAERG